MAVLAAVTGCLFGCLPDTTEGYVPDKPGDSQGGDTGKEQTSEDKHGIDYLYDGKTLPEIHIQVALNQWNVLLQAYDKNQNTDEEIHCNATYVKGGEFTSVTDAGLRLKGNTSRRRPEGSSGQLHNSSKTSWHHCHYALNFYKYVKDDAHKVHGAEKVTLKWFKDDPAYVREPYCYDLFRRDSVWTGSHTAYCRLYITVNGDSKETYLGIYDMIEPVDEDYLKVRKGDDQFGSAAGYLWKCRYGARLNDPDADIGPDLDDGREHTYELKTNVETGFSAAKTQLQHFLSSAKSLSGQAFHDWLSTHCDVDFLLRTYAVNVACGMWDDYWNDCNNYYIYFNSTDPENFKFFFIPYDYDNTLGTCYGSCGPNKDAAQWDPFNWGDSQNNCFIYKILQFTDWREIYRQHLLELVKPENALLYYVSSISRITAWKNMIKDYVNNDTGEDCTISDKPASWGNHSEYRLWDTGTYNYFIVKTNSINRYCK